MFANEIQWCDSGHQVEWEDVVYNLGGLYFQTEPTSLRHQLASADMLKEDQSQHILLFYWDGRISIGRSEQLKLSCLAIPLLRIRI